MTDTGTTASIETEADLGTGPSADIAFWRRQLDLAEKEDKDWIKRGEKIVKRYRDERTNTGTTRSSSKFNILWSNVQTLKPAMYGRTPAPDVERRFRDADPVGLMGSMILERSLVHTLDVTNFDHVMRCAVEDRLLPGRGTARIRYEAEFGDEEDDPDSEGETFRPLLGETVKPDYVFWKDFRHSPARQWGDVWWVAFRSYLTRDQLIDRFGKEIGKAVELDYAPEGMKSEDAVPDGFKKATVWEIWHKSKREVIWIPGVGDEILDQQDDPIGLSEFYPCPMPMYATLTTDKLVPVPDFAEYQDQADEIDALSTRIWKLQKMLKAAGIYRGGGKNEIEQLTSDGAENKLFPVENWGDWSSKGGLEKAIEWLPIEQIAKVLIQLYDARDRAKQVLYEVSGISDIIRGQTAPEETATAQQIKSQFATLRLSESQRDVSRFARDMFRLAGETMALHFDPETFREITGLPQGMDQLNAPPPAPMPPTMPAPGGMPPAPAAPPGAMPPQVASPAGQPPMQPPAPMPGPSPQMLAQIQAEQQFQAACAMLRKDAATGFRIDIEADSTILPDEQQEKQDRTEFVTAIGQLMAQGLPLVQQHQAFAPLVGATIMFMVRGYKAGRGMEEEFQKAVDTMLSTPAPPQQPPGGKGGENPATAAIAAHADLQGKQIDAQVASEKNQVTLQLGTQANQIKQAQLQQEAAFDTMKEERESRSDQAHLSIDAARLELARRGQELRTMRTESNAANGLV